MDSPWARNSSKFSSRPTARWGLGDFLLVYLGSVLLVSLPASAIAIGVTGADPEHPTAPVIAVQFLSQFLGFLLGIWLVSRFRGNNSLARDFGFRVSVHDWWAFPVGLGLTVVAGLMLAPLVHLAGNQDQQVVEDILDAGGAKLVVLVVAAGLLAPIFEELLFRGLLLRGLVRRMEPALAVGVGALIFAAVHLADPSLGTVARLPGLVLLGMVSGFLALRSGSLSQSILLHMGFNFVVVLSALA